ncbi:class I SAM-dependent methyltransferase [Microbacterium sp. APC 3898]|uniref:Class I SAM-dependent methyltransferase n=2 Tax=Planococcus TaxID=1372 RepID=A0ABT7ZJ07_9BACL|nr:MULTISPECIES: class I SAM-dependent methyltransferase [Terrabacteria group]MBD8016499.1 class I SAM-dependent methyltransferase [Planococcus wigleyi]MDN3427091.1 class I SAM-dependent methyltransferase [Planococcus sp. APC 4016]MDN3439646.1 class I SAM-dependent methyltransferase [Planococcus sp. APC 3900]MDN3499759.1 class I SAM-dependent methyltransferase [Microbacterium sp. APC 3898]
MTLERVLPFTKSLLEEAVSPGDCVIDGTAGNGHDTLFLAELTGPSGKVFAFDIQQEAIKATSEKVRGYQHVELVHDSHAKIQEYVKESVSAAVFNLGYLPKGDHSIITKAQSTLTALQQCLDLLKANGLLLVVVYSGHEGGSDERDAVMEFVSTLPQKSFDVLKYEFINQKHSPPFLLAVEKKKHKN